MPDVSNQQLLSAVQAFRAARWQATLEQIAAQFTGKSANLLSYEDVRNAIGARETAQRQLQEIPLNAIVGSVGRYADFTRSFLPRVEEDERRWAQVKAQMESMTGLPPIEVYKLGDTFFVRDGNHRVSVARQQGVSHIEAYVTEVTTPVPISPDDEPKDIILKARYAHFLAETELDKTFPQIDLTMSVAGNYRVLEAQIQRRRQWLMRQTNKDVTYSEAARLWYREIYWPIIQLIRQRGIMRDFPHRTETDLYVWIDKHRQALSSRLGWSIDAETAVRDLTAKSPNEPLQAVRQLGQKLRDTLTPTVLEAGPTVGQWRESWLATKRDDRLFSHILVAIDGTEAGWHALQQATRVAWREGGKIFGVHVVDSPQAVESMAARSIKADFERRCHEAGIPGEISITTGPTVGTLCYRARWTDLVVVSLSHPPGPQPVDRIGSQFGQLLRRCPRPVLAVPRTHAMLDSILLAYDGSPKAEEALYVAAYLAEQWQVSLTVVVALDKRVTKETAVQVRAYLDNHGIQARYVVKKSSPVPLILSSARHYDCGLVLMGGYGRSPMMEIVMGSVVDEVLRTHDRPVLICR